MSNYTSFIYYESVHYFELIVKNKNTNVVCKNLCCNINTMSKYNSYIKETTFWIVLLKSVST